MDHTEIVNWPLPDDPTKYCVTCDGIHDAERHQQLAELHFGAAGSWRRELSDGPSEIIMQEYVAG